MLEAPATQQECADRGRASAWADILTLGFGTTVAMWAAGFLCRLPCGPLGGDPVAPPPPCETVVPPAVLFALLLACLFGGGFAAGRRSARGWRGGLYAGALCSALNLLLLLGLLGDAPEGGAWTVLLCLPGSLLAGAFAGALGGAAGVRFKSSSPPPDWTWAFALVAFSATLLLIFVGGLVTSLRAGLAVPDWPHTFGFLMFLYPLSRMSGGVYFEHSHRLLGTLVGLTMLTLAVLVFLGDRRRGVRGLALIVLGLVVFQGVLGGLRVTGRLTLSASREELFPSTILAIIHGIAAQAILASVAALGGLLSPAWRSASPGGRSGTTQIERGLHAAFLGSLLLQLGVGAFLRHSSKMLLLHIVVGVLALVLAVASGAAAWGLHGAGRALGRIGRTLLFLAGLQVVLGVTVFALLGIALERDPSSPAQVILASIHQTAGALLLSAAALLVLFGRRFTRDAPARSP